MDLAKTSTPFVNMFLGVHKRTKKIDRLRPRSREADEYKVSKNTADICLKVPKKFLVM
jgi:hypothetical protein